MDDGLDTLRLAFEQRRVRCITVSTTLLVASKWQGTKQGACKGVYISKKRKENNGRTFTPMLSCPGDDQRN